MGRLAATATGDLVKVSLRPRQACLKHRLGGGGCITLPLKEIEK
jgi:hypothetical protein